MKTNFDPKSASWKKTTTAILPKHDLFFGSPICEPRAGIPLGDGDTGSLLWFEKDGIHININKCDLWSDSTWDNEVCCSGQEENLTCVKHGGEITLKFSAPILDYYYQKKFETRLSLADASVYMDTETPFGKIKCKMFSSAEHKVTVIDMKVGYSEEDSPELTLKRWGSRTFWRWYSQQKFAPEIGLDGTNSFAENNRLYITQDIGTTKFCIGLALVSKNDIRSRRKNSHECCIGFESSKDHEFTVYYTVRLGKDVEDAKQNCADVLDKAIEFGKDAIYSDHKEAWASFWNKSNISISDDYVENLYYHYLYIMNSESRGEYPPHFTSGLWGFNHDFVSWVYYFHYNIQHMYAPLDAAGHGELGKCYYDLRKNGLATAYRYAKEIKGKNGSFLHDVTDRYGRGATYDSLNCTPGAQVAMQMWHHWKHTGDEFFLKEYVLPQMKGVTEFYLDMFEKGEDGKYHIYNTTMYEGNRPTDDTLTDIVMVKDVFSAYRDFADPEMKKHMDDVLSNLPELPIMPLDEHDWDGEVFTFGIGKGRKPFGDNTVFSCGFRDGKPIRNSHGDPACHEYGFPDIELSPLYPAGIFGLKDKGTPDFDRMLNDLMIHGSVAGMHWNMIPIYLARMGLAEELKECLRERIDTFQSFNNGFGAEQEEEGCKYPYQGKEWDNVHNVDTKNNTKVRNDLFAHFDFEMGPILAQGVNDSLLQSHEGLLRLCPAVCKEDAVSFTLYAEGGFKVVAEVSADSYLVTVDSLRGEGLFLKLPEYSDLTKLHSYVKASGSCSLVPVEVNKVIMGREEVLSFNLNKGDMLLLSSVDISELEYSVQETAAPNSDMKECGKSMLGSPTLLK